MKKYFNLTLLILFCTLILIGGTEQASANKTVKIKALGKTVVSDVDPFVLYGRTMIPVRSVSEALGAKVTWSEYDKSIIIEKPFEKELYISTGGTMPNTMGASIYENGGYYGYNSYNVYLDVAAVIRNGRTFLPARVVAEELGYYVMWEAKTNTVLISEDYLGGQTYKEYLKTLSNDPYQWSPYLKEQFEATMIDSGYVDSKKNIKYVKSGVINDEGYYEMYAKINGKYKYVVGVNVKTGYYHG